MGFSQEELDLVSKLFDGKRGARSIAKELGVTCHHILCIYDKLGIDNSNVKVPTKDVPTHKICKICLQDKLIDEFRYRQKNNKKYYYEPYCKLCESKRGVIQGAKRYQKKGKQEFKDLYSDPDKKQEWLLKNKKYRHSNKDKLKAYRNTRREKDRKNLREWSSRKRRKDPSFKIRGIVSCSVRSAIRKFGKLKNDSIIKYLPYTINDLAKHLEMQFEPWMNWKNHGQYELKSWNDNDPSTWKWQIDHIIPHSDLPYDSMNHPNFQKCWSLNNLRPLSAKQNIEDGTRRVRHKIKTKTCIN